MTAKGRKKFDKGQNYSTSNEPYLVEIERWFAQYKSLHASHRTYLTSLLTSRGIPVPEGEREMLDAARGNDGVL